MTEEEKVICPAGDKGCADVRVSNVKSNITLGLAAIAVTALLYMATAIRTIELQQAEQTEAQNKTHRVVIQGQKNFARAIGTQFHMQKSINEIRKKTELPLDEIVVFNVDAYFPVE